ncbi:MAG: carnitine dehydratase [Acidimicrobiales bacterium]|nr:CoA transferase [Acidimicrobiaceae bacterium]MDE0678479.1 CoA transferase [Acidimicrobiaceae bacterium]MXV87580.1 carnitine dehydratase [Acidimicrobiales bacterium]MYB82451.1 carnitine dehydratase [Acidimicrobiales bacterium]MYI12051.1 carnitine dehydratase [Acidimicrobiales bacterium]
MTSAGGVRPLDGLRVVELTSQRCALGGKLLADMGADVIVVEPPGGSQMRTYEPFAGDRPDPEGALWWWHYNTSKRSVVVDLDSAAGAADFRRLVSTADAVIEAEPLGRLDALGLDWGQLGGRNRRLIWVSITHNGRDRPDPPATDLTVLAEGGPVWSCGYDDHTIPPVRGGGNQGLHMASQYAVVTLMAALMWREHSGRGQLIEVSMLAAANATCEFATYFWLNQQIEVQRQTGRHALPQITDATQVQCADGRWLNTGVPPRRGPEFAALAKWVAELGLFEECPYTELLALGEGYEQIDILHLDADPLGAEVFGAGRDTVNFLAARLGAHELFVGLQSIGLACGIVYSPEEMLADEHFVTRGFPVEIDHDGTAVTYPGAPYKFSATPWRATRAPRLGEHQDLLAE